MSFFTWGNRTSHHCPVNKRGRFVWLPKFVGFVEFVGSFGFVKSVGFVESKEQRISYKIELFEIVD